MHTLGAIWGSVDTLGLFPAWDRIAKRTGGGGRGVLRIASLTETYEYHIHYFIDIRDVFAAEVNNFCVGIGVYTGESTNPKSSV